MKNQIISFKVSNSRIAWELVHRNEDGTLTSERYGVRTFPDAVTHVKLNEVPSAQIRTGYRSLRKLHRRDRNRRADLLLVLSRNGYAPSIPEEDIKKWRMDAIFPNSPELREWMNANAEKNPYSDRHECLHRKLDFSKQEDRFTLGRALYHLSQRRGYMSRNGNDPDRGKVIKGINELTENMLASGCEFLGDYFFEFYGKRKIRSHYLSCKQHIKAEFDEICRVQELSDEFKGAVEFCIFRNTPLKSQKWQVGRCVYEKDKARCLRSHPLYEEFTFLQTINNMKVKTEDNSEYHRLINDTTQEKLIYPLFFRKSKPYFDFEEVASKYAGAAFKKKKKGEKSDARTLNGLTFNYRMDQSVPGCPVTAAIISALGEDVDYSNWKENLHKRYVSERPKSQDEAVNDLWHMLVFFDDESGDMQTAWLMKHIKGMDKDSARALASRSIDKVYGNLSLKAVKKILPYLREGYTYPEAILLANIPECLPGMNPEEISSAVADIKDIISDYRTDPAAEKKKMGLVGRIKGHLEKLSPDARPDKLWRIEELEAFHSVWDENAKVHILPPAITKSFKNPVVLRCLSQVRAVANELLKSGVIDSDTTVNYCIEETVNTLNMRKAIYERNNGNREEREEALAFLLDPVKAEKAKAEKKKKSNEAESGETEQEQKDPWMPQTEDNILRYRLWNEQKHKDPLTGEALSMTDAFDATKTVVDHIIPLDHCGSNRMVNMFLIKLSSRENREGCLVTEKYKADNLREIIHAMGWFSRISALEDEFASLSKKAKAASTRDDKNSRISERNLVEMELRYLKSKVSRILTEKNIDDSLETMNGRRSAQSKYLRMFLKSVFHDVNPVGVDAIAEFRKMWGIAQQSGTSADDLRDAITAACMDNGMYEKYVRYRKDFDTNTAYGQPLDAIPLPWPTFRQDVDDACESFLSSNMSDNRAVKKTKRKVRDANGRIVRNADGTPRYQTGESWRGALHLEHFHGMRMINGKPTLVLSIPVSSMEKKDVKNIVDPVLRKRFMEFAMEHGDPGKAYKKGIYLYDGNGFPYRSVLTYTFAQNPLVLKRDYQSSSLEHKRNVYVTNKALYCMVIHHDGTKMSFTTFNNLEAARYFHEHGTLPGKDCPTDQFIQKGTLVLMCRNSKEELKELSMAELSKRLHRVEALGITMYFKHHTYTGGADYKNGGWQPDGVTPPAFRMSYNKYPMAVEGEDFRISKTGEITFNF